MFVIAYLWHEEGHCVRAEEHNILVHASAVVRREDSHADIALFNTACSSNIVSERQLDGVEVSISLLQHRVCLNISDLRARRTSVAVQRRHCAERGQDTRWTGLGLRERSEHVAVVQDNMSARAVGRGETVIKIVRRAFAAEVDDDLDGLTRQHRRHDDTHDQASVGAGVLRHLPVVNRSLHKVSSRPGAAHGVDRHVEGARRATHSSVAGNRRRCATDGLADDDGVLRRGVVEVIADHHDLSANIVTVVADVEGTHGGTGGAVATCVVSVR